MPVFSNSPEKGIGIVYFTGPTMGYLIGFLFASFFAGYLNLNKNIFIIFIFERIITVRIKISIVSFRICEERCNL